MTRKNAPTDSIVDTRQDQVDTAASRAASDAWDPRVFFEGAPVMTRDKFLEEQSRRATEGQPLLGRAIIETPAGANPGEYAKETMRCLHNEIGRRANYAVLTMNGDTKAYIRMLEEGGTGTLVLTETKAPEAPTTSEETQPTEQDLDLEAKEEEESSLYQEIIQTLGDGSIPRAGQKAIEGSRQGARDFLGLPFSSNDDDITVERTRREEEVKQRALDSLSPGASNEEKGRRVEAELDKFTLDYLEAMNSALNREFGLDGSASESQYRAAYRESLREEAAELLAVPRSYTYHDIQKVWDEGAK